jgi:hypothetical protein
VEWIWTRREQNERIWGLGGRLMMVALCFDEGGPVNERGEIV